METDDEKISARIKMIDETEVTQSAQARLVAILLHEGHQVSEWSVDRNAKASAVITLNSPSCRLSRCSKRQPKA